MATSESNLHVTFDKERDEFSKIPMPFSAVTPFKMLLLVRKAGTCAD